jgi:hypothetical protein
LQGENPRKKTIVRITQTQTERKMTLSVSTVRKLAETLTPEVVEDILTDSKVIELLHEIIPETIKNHMGEVEEDLLYELSLCIMDNIYLKTTNKKDGKFF